MTDLAHLFDAPESLALYRVKRERDALRAALVEIADGYERHNPGWWIKKAKAALAATEEKRDAA